MSGKSDFTLLPTTGDVIRAKNDIRMKERKLKDLEKDMEMLKAWISPIRRLNADILSIIFEMCGEDDCKTSLQIAAVSRNWRNVVLGTPRAWVFLDLKDEPKGNTVQIYFHRSGQRPLHLFLPRVMSFISLFDVSQRIQCLNIDFSVLYMDLPCFPDVERLVIRGEFEDVRLSNLSTDYFPALARLLCDSNIVNPSIPSSEATFPVLAPLHTLSIVADDRPAWFDILCGCRNSLISLKIHMEVLLRLSSIVLPKLECLEIQYSHSQPATEHLELITPVLETYIEHSEYAVNASPLHLDLGTVQQMRLDQVATLSATPKLKLLQLEEKQNVYEAAYQLLLDDSLCPYLAFIKWTPEYDGEEESMTLGGLGTAVVHIMDKVNKRRNKPINLSVATPKTRDDGLLGIIKGSVVSSMPLTYTCAK
jgi:hypothetical protein